MQNYQSTQAYLAPLRELFGEECAQRYIQEWLSYQLSLVDNPDFANRFRGKFDRFCALPKQYMHRIVQVGSISFLAGIRFYGGDADRPFVDVIAWEGDIDFDVLKQAVAAEWEAFAPYALRVLIPSSMVIEGCYLDQSIHAQCVGKMNKSDSSVKLRPVENMIDAVATIENKYENIRQIEPELSREILAAGLGELEECRSDGTVDFILFNGEIAGLVATKNCSIEFIYGYVVVEQVVSPAFNGYGVAAKAQCALADRLCERKSSDVIAGTIQRENHASRKSAERAGRSSMFQYVFLDL